MHPIHQSWRVAARVGLLGVMLALGLQANAAEFKVGFVNVAIVLDQAPQAAEAAPASNASSRRGIARSSRSNSGSGRSRTTS